ncbi:hypothetical protein VN97_g6335, partial [Penicillium thymicola]
CTQHPFSTSSSSSNIGSCVLKSHIPLDLAPSPVTPLPLSPVSDSPDPPGLDSRLQHSIS